jgi:hypothetical protein
MDRSDWSRWIVGVGLLVVVLVVCGESATQTSGRSQPTQMEETTWSDANSVPGLRHAVARLRERIDVPILVPSKVPHGTTLDSRHPLRFYRRGAERTAVLHFVFGRQKHLYVDYGHATFDGCGGDRAKPVKVGGKPGLLSVSPIATWSALIWPALPRNPQGRYGLAGSFSGAEILALAESMQPFHDVSPHSAPPWC